MVSIIKVPYPLPSGLFVGRPAEQITDIIIHHTAGPQDQTPLQIDDFERRRPDDPDIYMPYGYLVDFQGNAYDGRPDLCRSAASFGRNDESIAVCVIGDYSKQNPTPAALSTLKQIVLMLHQTYPSICRTIGHRDIATMFYPNDTANYATACPGDKLYAKLPIIRNFVTQNVQDSTPVPVSKTS